MAMFLFTKAILEGNPVDVPTQWAVELMHPVETGVANFVAWYRSYFQIDN